jgi:hypothetical protein
MKHIKLFESFVEEKKGLWANVHAKRKRGEKPAKKGDEDYPDEKAWKSATEGKDSDTYEGNPGEDPNSLKIRTFNASVSDFVEYLTSKIQK